MYDWKTGLCDLSTPMII